MTHAFDRDKNQLNDYYSGGFKISEVKAVNVENTVRNNTGYEKRTTYGFEEIPASKLTADPQLQQ